jgi:hypothetical protein
VTAGHCLHGVPYFNGLYTTSAPWIPLVGIGATGQSYWGNTTASGTIRDAAILAPGFGLWAMYPGYFNWNLGGLSPLHDYYTTHAPQNIWMCLNGAASGSSCGQTGPIVPYVQSSTSRNGGVTRYLYDMQSVVGTCASEGDSGGPVTLASYEKALGIFSSASPINQCGNTMYVTPIWDPINSWGVLPHVI